MKRAALIEMLAERILRVNCPHPVRVAIDGVDRAGKTRLADELADNLRTCARRVILICRCSHYWRN
jgi:uridine kinase